MKNSKKIQKSFEKKIVIFSNIFLPILHNIGLYIYTVKYKSGIKIPSFLQNILKNFQNIFKKKKIFYCIRPNPKIFPSIFFIKKNCIFFMFKKKSKMDIVTSLWLSFWIWPTYQKSFSNLFF